MKKGKENYKETQSTFVTDVLPWVVKDLGGRRGGGENPVEPPAPSEQPK